MLLLLLLLFVVVVVAVVALFEHCSSKVLDHFRVLARVRNHFHLDVLEDVYIKVHSPLLCQQKLFAKVL